MVDGAPTFEIPNDEPDTTGIVDPSNLANHPWLCVDIGTTNTCACVVSGDNFCDLDGVQGKKTLMRSAVRIHDQNEEEEEEEKKQSEHHEFVDEEIRANSQIQDELLASGKVVLEPKSLIGVNFDSNETNHYQQIWPQVELQYDWNASSFFSWSQYGVYLTKSQKRPTEAIQLMLEQIALRVKQSKHLEASELNNIILTVPTYFDVEKKQAFQYAAKQAGFNNVILVKEPIAAAVAYATNTRKAQSTKTLVFHLGGRTMEITLLESLNTEDATSLDFRVLQNLCELDFGGQNFDELLNQYVMSNLIFQEEEDDEGSISARPAEQ